MDQKQLETAIAKAIIKALKDIDEKIDIAIEKSATEAAQKAAETGAKAALRAAQNEKKKIRETEFNNKLHNTKLLLRNYRALNEYCNNSVYEIQQAASNLDQDWETIYELMNLRASEEKIYIESIMKNTQRTKAIMTHVNRMLDIFKTMCEKSDRQEDIRRWNCIKAMYLDDANKTAEEIADEENIHARTVYKDIDAACETLTTLFFGVSGIKGQK